MHGLRETGNINIHSRLVLKFKNEKIETTMGRIIFNPTVQDILQSYDIVDDHLLMLFWVKNSWVI